MPDLIFELKQLCQRNATASTRPNAIANACSTWWRRPTSGTRLPAHGCSKPHAQARRGSGGTIAGWGSDRAGESRARFALSVCKPCDTEALHVSQQASGLRFATGASRQQVQISGADVDTRARWIASQIRTH